MQRKLLPQKFSRETGGHISSPQPMLSMQNNRQAGRQGGLSNILLFQESLFVYDGHPVPTHGLQVSGWLK